MNDDVRKVRQYYDENAAMEWERLEKHPFEFLLTVYMMEKHIKPGDSILDIGGGPGRYAIHFAKMGCKVTLIDLSEGNVALAREKAIEAGVTIDARQGDCLNLNAKAAGQFDHVFLMGPLYHLIRPEDRERAVTLALECLKPGGLFYASFIMEFAGFIYDLKNGPGLLPRDWNNPETHALSDAILNGESYQGPAFTSVSFINPRQIEPFMARFPLKKIHLFGQEGILAPNENQVLSYPMEERALWLKAAEKFLEVPELLCLSEHAMYIGKLTREGSAADGGF